tara:strand:+ start:10365 stop:10958 length:594 start_codon:yes stop_codon:yes gene_type:complete
MWLINISGFFGIISDQKDFFLASTPIVLTITLFLLLLNQGLDRKGLLAISLIFLFGLIVEILGVNFSLFFGNYEYGNNLGIKIYGVPIVIGFNWVLLVMITGNFADKIFSKNIFFKTIFGSTLMVILDLLIEVVAPKIGYWEFDINPVPTSNYLWWFIFSIIFHYIYQKSVSNKEYLLSINILAIHFLFFGMLSVFL